MSKEETNPAEDNGACAMTYGRASKELSAGRYVGHHQQYTLIALLSIPPSSQDRPCPVHHSLLAIYLYFL